MRLFKHLIYMFYLSFSHFASSIEINRYGFISYCPCMGRFGNQADHFLGALAFSKGVNRTLILPPWVEYRYGEPQSIQVPFDTYFDVETLTKYHDVITMDLFMRDIAPSVWPESERVSFCYMQRNGEVENSCNAKSGNPFGPFWDTFGIDFVRSEFYGPLNYDAHNEAMMTKWKQKYSPKQWPVLAFTGAPASFPVQKENVILQKYLRWSDEIESKARVFIKNNMSGGGFIGIHLRNGQDWVKACQHVRDSNILFAAPQCVGYKNERGPLTLSMCLPQPSTIIKNINTRNRGKPNEIVEMAGCNLLHTANTKEYWHALEEALTQRGSAQNTECKERFDLGQIKRAVKKQNNTKYIFVASDSNHMIDELSKAFHNTDISVMRLLPSNPHLDLAVLGKANYFIGNCVSSYSAFVKRERDSKGLPSEFWSFPSKKKNKHEEL